MVTLSEGATSAALGSAPPAQRFPSPSRPAAAAADAYLPQLPRTMTARICLVVPSIILLQLLTLVTAAQPDAPPPPSASADPPPLRPLADWAAALLTHNQTAADGPLTAPRMSQRVGEQGSNWQRC